jgi:hypothetical protein
VAESVVVTDGTDSFYGSRTLFQFLHDFGEFDKITAFGPSVVDAKKMLLSRQVRSPTRHAPRPPPHPPPVAC